MPIEKRRSGSLSLHNSGGGCDMPEHSGGNFSRLFDEASENVNSRAERSSALRSPALHLRPRRGCFQGERNERPIAEQRSRLVNECGAATQIRSGPAQDLCGTSGNLSRLSGEACENIDTHAERFSTLRFPTSHLRPRRGGRSTRASAASRGGLVNDCGTTSQSHSGPMQGLYGTSSSYETTAQHAWQSAGENIGPPSVHASTVQRQTSRARGRRGSRNTRAGTSNSRPAYQYHGNVPPDSTDPTQSIPSTSSTSGDASRHRARAGDVCRMFSHHVELLCTTKGMY